MKIVIKTVDGNRYELTEMPVFIHMYETNWLAFNRDGCTKNINIKHIVSITERDEE